MAIFNSVLMGGVRNSVDNVTMYESRGRRIARRKPSSVRNPRTDKQRRQRAKMKLLVELSMGFVDVAAVGFAGRNSKMSPVNAFVAANMPNVTVDDEYVATLDYKTLACSLDKKRKRPSVTASLEGMNLSFAQSEQEYWGTAKKDDAVYAVLLDEVLGETMLVPLKNRGEGGMTSVTLPDDWQPEKLHVYVFAASADGKRTSATVYLDVARS